MESETTLDEPCFVQGQLAPLFRGAVANNAHLDCSCGHRLIEHYYPACYIAVSLKCFKCKEVTCTPGLAEGEILPISLLSVGEGRKRYLIDGTVQVPLGVALTSREEILKANKLTAPRRSSMSFEVGTDSISTLESKFNELTCGKRAVQLAAASRHDVAVACQKYPFVWAAEHLRSCLQRGVISDRAPYDLFALRQLYLFQHVINTWSHHPRFLGVAREFESSFEHTCAVLIAAAHFYECGNPIGFTAVEGGPRPDLYTRFGAQEHLFMEVKTPESLRWSPRWELSVEGVRKAIWNALDGCRHQLNRSRKGILIVSSSATSHDVGVLLDEAALHVLGKKGRDRKGVAGIVTLTSRFQLVATGAEVRVEMGFTPKYRKNPHFDGENPLRVD